MWQLSRPALGHLGFASVTKDVTISDKASFYNRANIRIGNYMRAFEVYAECPAIRQRERIRDLPGLGANWHRQRASGK